MNWQATVYGRWQGSGKRKKRKRPPKAVRERVLREQENRCAYCIVQFGTITRSRIGRSILAKCTWDHVIPYIHDHRQTDENWVAACQVCNGIKGDLMFDSILQAKDYIAERRWRHNHTR